MRHPIVRTIALAILSLGLAAAAWARDEHCSNARLAGHWGYTKTGTVFTPTGAVPFASVGRLDFDAAGNVSGTHEASVGGSVGRGTLNRTFALNSDCLGTMTIGVYDPSGNLLRTVSMSLVLDEKARGSWTHDVAGTAQ
ncbi:MAG TPA: hypothetical protein VLS25_13810 [Dehalococcoidia bacterium]|nr:hypothetical protein [Dehalococcoidia bacterium]